MAPRLSAVLERSAQLGFLGPAPVSDHLSHAEGFAHALPKPDPGRRPALLDLGSGGGVPGLALLVWRADLRGVLLDARAKRTRFLSQAVAELDLSDRVSVVTGRAEELVLDPASELSQCFDVVVARSFGPPSATVEVAVHFLRPGGMLLVSEPPKGRRWAADGLHRVGLEQVLRPDTCIARFDRIGDTPPFRRWKHMVTRPLIEVRALTE
jgi:16S rRNA (guanine527-N7)-methyltransferase